MDIPQDIETKPLKPLVLRDERGLFLPGSAPLNPGGRPKGTISLKETMKRSLTAENAKRIVEKLMEMADAGNIRAVELICQLIDEGRDNKITINTGNSILLSDAEMIAKAKAYTKSLPKQETQAVIEDKKE